MNKTFTVLYLVMLAVLSVIAFIFMPISFTSVIFAVILIVNIFLFIDVFKRDK